MYAWMDGWLDRQIDARMHGCMDGMVMHCQNGFPVKKTKLKEQIKETFSHNHIYSPYQFFYFLRSKSTWPMIIIYLYQDAQPFFTAYHNHPQLLKNILNPLGLVQSTIYLKWKNNCRILSILSRCIFPWHVSFKAKFPTVIKSMKLTRK